MSYNRWSSGSRSVWFTLKLQQFVDCRGCIIIVHCHNSLPHWTVKAEKLVFFLTYFGVYNPQKNPWYILGTWQIFIDGWMEGRREE